MFTISLLNTWAHGAFAIRAIPARKTSASSVPVQLDSLPELMMAVLIRFDWIKLDFINEQRTWASRRRTKHYMQAQRRCVAIAADGKLSGANVVSCVVRKSFNRFDG